MISVEENSFQNVVCEMAGIVSQPQCVKPCLVASTIVWQNHDDVIKWKHLPRYWPFVWEIHRSPLNFPHKGQWRGALVFSLICIWINGWVNNGEAGDLRRHCAHHDVTIMWDLYNTCWCPLEPPEHQIFHLIHLYRISSIDQHGV